MDAKFTCKAYSQFIDIETEVGDDNIDNKECLEWIDKVKYLEEKIEDFYRW